MSGEDFTFREDSNAAFNVSPGVEVQILLPTVTRCGSYPGKHENSKMPNGTALYSHRKKTARSAPTVPGQWFLNTHLSLAAIEGSNPSPVQSERLKEGLSLRIVDAHA
jgi:hypothetical protein